MNLNSGDLSYILKRFALFAGIILAIFSIWFSWDGLDQTVTGNNPNYSEMAKFAGAVLAIVMTLLQFIFNTSFHSLSLTLKIAVFSTLGLSLMSTMHSRHLRLCGRLYASRCEGIRLLVLIALLVSTTSPTPL